MNRKKYLPIALLSLLMAGGESQGQSWEKTTWSQTLYYRGVYDADIPSDQEVTLYVVAVDSYEVYFNGTLVGGDDGWTQMTAYPVTLEQGDNNIAVKVTNRGVGAGNGVMAAIVGSVTDSLGVVSDFSYFETTTDRSQVVWVWTDQEQEDDAWTTTSALSEEDGWHFVQTGSVDATQVQELYDPAMEIIAGFPEDVDIGSVDGSIVLKQIRGQNLALNSVTNRLNAVDGDLKTSWDPPTNALSNTAPLDLQTRHNLNTVRILTRGPAFRDNSLRGYVVQISDDQIRWSEVGSLVDIGEVDTTQFLKTEVKFRSTWTRFLRIFVTQINGVTAPRVGEIEVFGEGFTDRGVFVSEPLDLGSPNAPKNFGQVSWQAVVPTRTALSVQFRTGNEADNPDGWGQWSPPFLVDANGRASIRFPSAEPRNFFQYRVNMVSEDPDRTPAFDGIQLDFSASDIPVSAARGRVAPNRVPMGVDTAFVYTLSLDFAAGDLGVEKIWIEVPSQAVLAEDQITGLDAGQIQEWRSTQNVLELVLAEPLTNVDELTIPFAARTFSNVHEFRALLFGPGSDNPLNAAQDTEVDPLTAEPYSWSAIATTSLGKTLSEVRATPSVFSPNGDGDNDNTVFEFILSKVDTPREVKIQIFDLSGRMVAELNPDPVLAGTYLSSGQTSPGYWDGRGMAGALVPPGIYLYRVELDLDENDEIESGIVGVVY